MLIVALVLFEDLARPFRDALDQPATRCVGVGELDTGPVVGGEVKAVAWFRPVCVLAAVTSGRGLRRVLMVAIQ